MIEPIKPTSTLLKTLKVLVEKEKKFAFIHNPQVGSFVEEFKNLNNRAYSGELQELLRGGYCTLAHVINKNSNIQLHELLSTGVNKEDIMLIHNRPDFIHDYNEHFPQPPRYNLIPYILKRKIKDNIVLFEDHFPKQERNVDYLNEDSLIFSDDHIDFETEGFFGFSDYSIVGKDFTVKGFAPRAVAIHIVYFDENDVLRVKHFVSDRNDDITDPAGKFYEALSKLVSWNDKQQLNTDAIEEFKQYQLSKHIQG